MLSNYLVSKFVLKYNINLGKYFHPIGCWWMLLWVASVVSMYSVFHSFRQSKFAYVGLILSSSQILLLPQLPHKMTLASEVVKIVSKIIISIPKISICESHRRNRWRRVPMFLHDCGQETALEETLCWDTSSSQLNFCTC